MSAAIETPRCFEAALGYVPARPEAWDAVVRAAEKMVVEAALRFVVNQTPDHLAALRDACECLAVEIAIADQYRKRATQKKERVA